MSGPDRRDVLAWSAVVAAAVGMQWGGSRLPSGAPTGGREGYGIDPPLLEPRRGVWPHFLGQGARRDLAALIDVVVPGLEGGPPGSELGLVEFFDEWLGAPYPDMVADRELVMPMLADIGGIGIHAPPLRAATVERLRDGPHAAALSRFCVLAAAAYHTTPVGIAALRFVGNEPRASFDGPPPAVLAHFEREFAKLGFPDDR